MPTKGKLLFTDVSIVNSIAWCAHSKLKGSQQQRQGRALGRRYRRRIFCCPTELISRYFDKIIAPIVRSLPSYITDSQHALEIFNDFNLLCEDKLIFTMDITSLNTFLPNGEGVLALHLFVFFLLLLFIYVLLIKEPSSETLLRLTELVLTLDCFSFAENYYK